MTTTRLLLRSMGYRDTLIGGLLATAALRGRDTRGWFLASGGADAADLLGGISVHHEMNRSQRLIGLGAPSSASASGYGARRVEAHGLAIDRVRAAARSQQAKAP